MSAEINHKERAHALLSASGASRWMACTPSAVLEDGYEEKTSVYAEEGTLAHELAEIKLRSKLNQVLGNKSTPQETKQRREQVAKVKANPLYSAEMETYTDEYVAYVIGVFIDARKKDPAAVLLIERKLDFSMYVPEGFGTGDVLILHSNVVIVIDLKYGAGKKVSAFENPQMKLYGVGALNELEMLYDIEEVELVIYQPRMDNISEYKTHVDALLSWVKSEVVEKANLAINGEGELVTGDHCGFCKHRSKCKAMYEETKALFDEVKEDIFTTSDEQILEVFEKASRVTSYLEAIKAHVTQTAIEGKKWEGYKVVEGRSNRVISDVEKADALLKKEGFKDEDIYNMKLKGLGDLEKLVGKKNFETVLGSVVTKPPGAPTIAPESDKRPELNLVESAKKLFNDLDI